VLWIAAAFAALVILTLRAQRSEAARKSSSRWLVGIAAALLLVASLRFGGRALLLGIPFAAWLILRFVKFTRVAPGNPIGGQRPRGVMTREEALHVLGLSHGASPDEIVSAHRNLIKKVHPDQGGSGFLTQQVNEARDVLLKR
jgi:hypothetical protein